MTPTTIRHPSHAGHAECRVAQRQGGRTVQADAYAIRHDLTTGRIAVVVADGVGDRVESAEIANLGADRAAKIAARTGSPVSAIYNARRFRNRREIGYPDYVPELDYVSHEPDTVLTVAVIDPRDDAVRVAWAGDCRAYSLGNGARLHQITVDHTKGEEYRELGIIDRDEPPCHEDNIITSRLAYGPIDTAEVPVDQVRALLLCSDGVSKQLTDRLILDLLHDGYPYDAAESVADCAAEDPHSDNVTAVVLDLTDWRTPCHLR